MKIYGLCKIINQKNLNCDGFELFNFLHPDQKLNNIGSFDIEPKTYYNFFYEDNPAILKADISIQHKEYTKFKNHLDSLINKKTMSQYEHDVIIKMLHRLTNTETKFLAYKSDVAKITEQENHNKRIIDDLEKKQSQVTNVVGKDILYPNSIISFCKTAVSCIDGGIIIGDQNITEYIVFELEPNQSIKLKLSDDIVNKIKKLNDIQKICQELNISVPENVINMLNNLSRQILYWSYKDKNLAIYIVDKCDKELEYEVIIPSKLEGI